MNQKVVSTACFCSLCAAQSDLLTDLSSRLETAASRTAGESSPVH